MDLDDIHLPSNQKLGALKMRFNDFFEGSNDSMEVSYLEPATTFIKRTLTKSFKQR